MNEHAEESKARDFDKHRTVSLVFLNDYFFLLFLITDLEILEVQYMAIFSCYNTFRWLSLYLKLPSRHYPADIYHSFCYDDILYV